MGIKSTTTLTRAEAIVLLEEYRQRLNPESHLTDTQLEDELENLNDLWFRQEYGSYSGFDNYIVKD